MPPASDSQRVKLRNLLDARSMMRAQELREAGISPQTIARAAETGEIERISRGVYQKRGSEVEENQIMPWQDPCPEICPGYRKSAPTI